MAYNFEEQYSSPNYTPASETQSVWHTNRNVQHIDIHHWGDPATNPTIEGVIATFLNPNSGRSANFIATGTGRTVACMVSPEDNSWATVQDNPYSISIECDPRCRDEDYDVVAELIADIRHDYGDNLELHPHREFFPTACPGNWDLARLDALSRTKVSNGQFGQTSNVLPPPVLTPEVVAAAVPVEKQPQKAVDNPYTRFSSPMNLIANKQPTDVYDVSKATNDEMSANIVKKLNKGDDFIAVGKYKHPAGGVYFMTAYSFGNADTTGTPDHSYGINTVDLSPAPTVDTPVAAVVTPEPQSDVTPESEAVAVPVTVKPADPNKWQQSFVTYGHGSYIASQQVIVKDLAGLSPDLNLLRGQTVTVAGEFIKDGVTYYRTQHSVDTGKWYGIPVKVNGYNTLADDDNIFNDFLTYETEVIEKEVSKAKDGAIKAFASIDGILHPFKKKQ